MEQAHNASAEALKTKLKGLAEELRGHKEALEQASKGRVQLEQELRATLLQCLSLQQIHAYLGQALPVS